MADLYLSESTAAPCERCVGGDAVLSILRVRRGRRRLIATFCAMCMAGFIDEVMGTHYKTSVDIGVKQRLAWHGNTDKPEPKTRTR